MLGTFELIVIFCIALLLFGSKRLPEIAKSLGQGVREFRRACQTDEKEAASYDTREDSNPK
ncbi:Sec-independent protein translocase subunit TatA/TatB [Criblamydia sequanensis]|uniref:Sec-independent protein translocase protein TatA n=1 Tax=Candidatus Criblamydia sequanensis CRIB-18 TaxID=1437425 RepID=A0A090E106_9BACT|nr:twin-arginine translocase TatA/TatE family subunit [Criblamydia sequanensis]CDR34464.1 Sec-independent protein translocase protein tatA/E [Criblamydia sequanensis CRIB-18]